MTSLMTSLGIDAQAKQFIAQEVKQSSETRGKKRLTSKPKVIDSQKSGKAVSMPGAKKASVKPKKRMPPGKAALQEIQRLQKIEKLQIPKAAFYHFVHELTQKRDETARMQLIALQSLCEFSERWLTRLFEDVILVASFAGRVTILLKDLHTVILIRNNDVSDRWKNRAMNNVAPPLLTRLCVREEGVSRQQTNGGARLVQERNKVRDITRHGTSEEVKSVRTRTKRWRTNLVEMHREASKRKLLMAEIEKRDNDIDIRRREKSSKYTPKSKTVRRKTQAGATLLAPSKYVTEKKREHNKGEATVVDSAEVEGSGEDIEGSMRCGRQASESSGGCDIQHIGECEDEQLEQNEANTEEGDSKNENNRDNDDFGERESNEDEDDDNEDGREENDENDAHFTNDKAIVMRGREKRGASEKSKLNNHISDNIHTLYAHSKIVKQLMCCVAKGFCLSRAKDAEMYPSVDTYLESFRGLTESLDPDTRFIVDQSMKSTTPTTLRTLGSSELTNIRGEIAYDIVRSFWSAAGLPYPCGTVRNRFEKEREEMRTKMLEQSSGRVKGDRPWGATEFKNVVRDVLYRDWDEAGRNGCTLQQLPFAHMVLECHISNKS
ncbi:hypothetical protein CBR_g40138 [Chara braunii]|uniref:Core Histone H2A/H2B/H3 domain-containing protein n=1 Tax=Chara braunii TaxID=69332 RepID=A0A388LTB3_CHABU|nr:hypothetical protein CBR_g40138 [Chara braunii]|eukprot:GBG85499.1 hypothetical protein CBR_g40138 [Chara braunii]